MRVGQSGSNNQVQSTETSAAKKTGKAQAANKNGETSAAESKSGSAEGAKAEISSKAREFAQAKEVASNAPDVREEKIAELKRRIASGSYSVDANAVADRMVDDHLKTAMG